MQAASLEMGGVVAGQDDAPHPRGDVIGITHHRFAKIGNPELLGQVSAPADLKRLIVGEFMQMLGD